MSTLAQPNRDDRATDATTTTTTDDDANDADASSVMFYRNRNGAASATAAASAAHIEYNIRNLEKLASCELNKRVRFSNTRECIEFQLCVPNKKPVWKPISGLIERIRECFYPHYDFLRANSLARKYERGAKTTMMMMGAMGAMGAMGVMGVMGATPPSPPSSSAAAAAAAAAPAAHPALVQEERRLGKRARELGEHVDREHSALINRDILQGSASEAAAAAAAAAPSVTPSLYTRILLNVKRQWHWHSYMAQFIVCAPELGVGTRIDELCYDDESNLIVVEHKVGYKNYRTRATAMMNEPLHDIDNSPGNQHVLQCGIALLMLEHYWHVHVPAAFVVYIDDAEVIPVPLPEWFWERKQAIWERFVEQMNRRFR